MTAKILNVINAICNHLEWLTEITKSSNEYYFRYKGHVMSLLENSNAQDERGQYTLFVYPEEHTDLHNLAGYLEDGDPEDIKMASYHSKEFGDEVFGRLFSVLESKHLGIDAIFDNILADDN